MVGLGMCMHMLSDSGVISFMLPRLCACMLLYSNHTTVGSSSFGYVFVVFCCKGSKQIVHRAGNSVGSIMELMVVKPFSIALNAVAPPHASMLMLQLLLLACVFGMVLGIAMMCACSTVWGNVIPLILQVVPAQSEGQWHCTNQHMISGNHSLIHMCCQQLKLQGSS